MHNDTTRKYPRTLEEAFPQDGHQAEWFYPPVRKHVWMDYVASIVIKAINLWRKYVSNR